MIEAVFRREHGRVLAALISNYGDLDIAEDALQDALIAALAQWPEQGLPDNPGAWLTTVAKRRAIDRLRGQARRQKREMPLEAELHAPLQDSPQENSDMTELIPDERLSLMFMCCHPALPMDSQVAMTLRALGGLTTEEIARAFLVSLPTMAQRLTRARTKIRAAGIPFRVPPAHLIAERLDSLLAVLYLIFNEGYVATAGDTLIRHELCSEAIRLVRTVVDLLEPNSISAEARGLLALMLLHGSRNAARTAPDGGLIVLEQQNRSLWDHAQITEGTQLLDAALRLGNPGPYQVQAAISALHCQSVKPELTDWAQIAALYGVLAEMTESPIIEVNRAVAVGMAAGPHAGLKLLGMVEAQLDLYYPFHVAKAELLLKCGEREAAQDALERASVLCQNAAQRDYLMRRLRSLDI
jgi:RNA polymerase sigma-70 factor (ECF subfamily)